MYKKLTGQYRISDCSTSSARKRLKSEFRYNKNDWSGNEQVREEEALNFAWYRTVRTKLFSKPVLNDHALHQNLKPTMGSLGILQ